MRTPCCEKFEGSKLLRMGKLSLDNARLKRLQRLTESEAMDCALMSERKRSFKKLLRFDDKSFLVIFLKTRILKKTKTLKTTLPISINPVTLIGFLKSSVGSSPAQM